jgi:hypothetical protein
MQSDCSGHIGGKGNFSCRKCTVGGTQKDKETNEGFHSMFEVGNQFFSMAFAIASNGQTGWDSTLKRYGPRRG